MSDQPRSNRPSISRSGFFKRPEIEPELLNDATRRPPLPEQKDGGGTTGTIQIANLGEGTDRAAEQSDDDLAHGK